VPIKDTIAVYDVPCVIGHFPSEKEQSWNRARGTLYMTFPILEICTLNDNYNFFMY